MFHGDILAFSWVKSPQSSCYIQAEEGWFCTQYKQLLSNFTGLKRKTSLNVLIPLSHLSKSRSITIYFTDFGFVLPGGTGWIRPFPLKWSFESVWYSQWSSLKTSLRQTHPSPWSPTPGCWHLPPISLHSSLLSKQPSVNQSVEQRPYMAFDVWSTTSIHTTHTKRFLVRVCIF